jgi:bifunctional non-homologous end joining protein LigD
MAASPNTRGKSKPRRAAAQSSTRAGGPGRLAAEAARSALGRALAGGTILSGGKVAVQLAGKELVLSNLDKVLYPQPGFTKAQVIDYYLRVAPAMLPHLRRYPISLKRYPNGVDRGHFFEKRCPARPDWVATANVPVQGGSIDFCVVDNLHSLVWLANLACLEIHVYLAHGDTPDTPRMMVFDLDPGAPASLLECARVGVALRELLAHFSLESLVKVSGSKGLHVYVPLNRAATFEQTKGFARAVALLLERRHPDTVTSVMAKKERGGKVFIDWSQNDRSKTTVGVYSLRAREQPTVSAPVRWDEVAAAISAGDARGLTFDTEAVLARIDRLGDLFAPLLTTRQKLPEFAPD